jgi:hypothetical protein
MEILELFLSIHSLCKNKQLITILTASILAERSHELAYAQHYDDHYCCTGCIKKTHPRNFLRNHKDFRPLGIEIELLIDHITVVVH